MKSEDVVQSEIRQQAGRRGILLWRNNSGAMQDPTGRVVRYGLGNDSAQLNRRLKSSDLIGVFSDRAFVDFGVYKNRRTFGVFIAVECKEEGWRFPEKWRGMSVEEVASAFLMNMGDAQIRTLAQWRFLTLVHDAGGLAGFATSVADFDRILAGELVLP